MKLTKKQRRYIKTNIDKESIEDIAKKLKLDTKTVEDFVKDKKIAKKIKKRRKKKQKLSIFLEREKFKNLKDIAKFIKETKGVVIIMLVLTFCTYINSISGEFVADDVKGIVNSPKIETIGTALKTKKIDIVMNATIHKAFGLEEEPYHLSSITFHLINVVFVYVFISMLLDRRIAIVATFLYSVHPAISETVAWISAREYIVTSISLMSSLILFILYKNSSEKKYILVGATIFSASLGTFVYPWLMILPLLLFIVDQIILEKRPNIKALVKETPYHLVAIGYIAFYITHEISNRVVKLQAQYGLNQTELPPFYIRAPYTVWMMAKLLIFPKDLTLYHEGTYISNFRIFTMVVLVAVILISMLYALKKDKRIAGVIMFLFAAIAPAFSPIQVAWLIAERYMYISAIAFCILLAALFIKLELETKISNLTMYLLIFTLVGYSARTIVRNNEWRTRKSLWESTARVSPNSPRVYNNLGDVYGVEGDHQRAVEAFQKAIQIDPGYSEAMHNLGNAYIKIGEADLAQQQFEQAIQTNPNQYQSVYGLGLVELSKGNKQKANEYFNKVLQFDPSYFPAQEGVRLTSQ